MKRGDCVAYGPHERTVAERLDYYYFIQEKNKVGYLSASQ